MEHLFPIFGGLRGPHTTILYCSDYTYFIDLYLLYPTVCFLAHITTFWYSFCLENRQKPSKISVFRPQNAYFSKDHKAQKNLLLYFPKEPTCKISAQSVQKRPWLQTVTHTYQARKSPDGHLVFWKLKFFTQFLTDFHQILTRFREKNTLQNGIRNSRKRLFFG